MDGKSFCLFYHKYCTYILRYILNITTKLKNMKAYFFSNTAMAYSLLLSVMQKSHTLPEAQHTRWNAFMQVDNLLVRCMTALKTKVPLSLPQMTAPSNR